MAPKGAILGQKGLKRPKKGQKWPKRAIFPRGAIRAIFGLKIPRSGNYRGFWSKKGQKRVKKGQKRRFLHFFTQKIGHFSMENRGFSMGEKGGKNGHFFPRSGNYRGFLIFWGDAVRRRQQEQKGPKTTIKCQKIAIFGVIG